MKKRRLIKIAENWTLEELRRNCKAVIEELEQICKVPDASNESHCERIVDWINEQPFVNFVIGADGKYLYGIIVVNDGGPRIEISTQYGYVNGGWGAETAQIWLGARIRDALDAVLEAVYAMVK